MVKFDNANDTIEDRRKNQTENRTVREEVSTIHINSYFYLGNSNVCSHEAWQKSLLYTSHTIMVGNMFISFASCDTQLHFESIQ